MNKEKVWACFIQQNPRLITNPRMSPEDARIFFEKTWNAAYEAGAFDMAHRDREIFEGKEEHAHNAALKTLIADAEEMLSTIFGPKAQAQKIYVKKENKKKSNGGAE
jgi:hypothetical protein